LKFLLHYVWKGNGFRAPHILYLNTLHSVLNE
jgi:hypothetical protein